MLKMCVLLCLTAIKSIPINLFCMFCLHTGCWWSPLFQTSHQSNINKINSTSKEESCLVGTSVQTNHIFISQFCGPFSEPSNVLILQLPGHIYTADPRTLPQFNEQKSTTDSWILLRINAQIHSRLLDSSTNQCTNPQRIPRFYHTLQ